MGSENVLDLLRHRAAIAGLVVEASIAAKLAEYFELLTRWNETINLTALTDPDVAVDRLLVEPAMAARELRGIRSILDVGSGGGSPAIPLALATRAAQLVMVESRQRKAAFLREAVRQLGLNAVVETSRYEELLAAGTHVGSIDIVSVRGVRMPPAALEALAAFLTPIGRIALFHGPAEVRSDIGRLQRVRTVPLVPSLGSRLTLLRVRG